MESIQSTNHEAVKCKAAAVQCGLLNDPYIHLFHNARESKEPLILKGTAIRTMTLDNVLSSVIGSNDQHYQVVNLGCGFDTRCLLLSNARFHEVDVPEVISRKESIIRNSNVSNDSKFVPCDINDVDNLVNMLMQAGLSFSRPIVLFAECCLMYLNRQSVRDIVDSFVERCSNLIIITFDAIKGDDEFGRRMMTNLNLKMPFFESCMTVDDYLDVFNNGQIKLVDSFDLLTAEHKLDEEDAQRITRLCPLDEYEEWKLISTHYIFAIFSSTPLKHSDEEELVHSS